uniref:Uncharacterized protein n=1 Tax=Arion vulgaris TaxID=1028688 RepID=A0A0B7ANK6_9EUPU
MVPLIMGILSCTKRQNTQNPHVRYVVMVCFPGLDSTVTSVHTRDVQQHTSEMSSLLAVDGYYSQNKEYYVYKKMSDINEKSTSKFN